MTKTAKKSKIINSIRSSVVASVRTVEQRQKDADRIYANHVITSRNETSWVIKGADKMSFWAEIMVGVRGALVMTGDGPDMILRSWYDHKKPRGLVHWVGHSSSGYIGEKVHAGKRFAFDGKQAVLDVLEFFESAFENYEERRHGDIAELRDRVLKDWEREMERIERWKKDDADPSRATRERDRCCELSEDGALDLWKEIYELTEDFELRQFGKTLSDDLLRTQAACRRLAALLEAEEGPVSDGE